jgi:outer membrane protein
MLRAILIFFCASDPSQARTLSLSQAIETAMSHQPTLRQARAGTDAAEGRVEQARSGYLPQLNGNASYQRTTANFTPRPGVSTTLQAPPKTSWNMYDFFSFGVTGSQLIYDFGQTTGRMHAAEASRESFRATEQTTALNVVLGVRRAYYTALAQEELVRVATETLENQDKHLTQTDGLVRAGIRPDIDLAQVRTNVANARLALINAQNGVLLAKAQLGQAIGVVGDFTLVPEETPAVAGEDGPTEQLVDEALGARPDIASLERSRKAQEATITGLRGGYGPSLSATAMVTDAGTGLNRLVPNWAAGAVLSWPFLQGGFTTGQLHEAHANLSNILAQTDSLRLQVRVDVDQAQLAVRAAKAAGVAAEDAQLNAREQLRLAEGRYTAGLGNAIELSDAQVAYTNAAAQVVQARFNLAVARAQLSSAIGKR